MFGLPQQVGGAQFTIDRIVCDHQGFRRTGQQIDPDLAEQQSLGFSHISVARPDDDVCGGSCE